MNKIILTLAIAILSFATNAFQKNAPWIQKEKLKRKSNPTLKEVSRAAENYFKTIDRNKKGSGLKPFERWKYHWSFYTKQDGTIAPAKDLWTAWKQKNEMNTSNTRTDASNWTSMGPYSHTNTSSWSSGQGRVNAIAVDPNNSNIYYAGAPAGGIWKSTDAGMHWTPLTDHLPQIGVSGIAIDPANSSVIYVATGDDDGGDSYAVGVWKSTDGGTTWNEAGNIEADLMNDIYIHPTNSSIVIVATSSGVYKSTNAGATWSQKLSENIRDLKMKPNDPTTWYAASSNTFYKSIDSGETFQAKTITGLTNSTRLVMDVTPANNNYIYIVSAGDKSSFNGVYKSIDSGETFTKTLQNDDIFESSQAWFDLALTVSDTNPQRVYVGVLNIWESTNGGDNFTRINNWSAPYSDSYTHADIHSMRFIDGKFFVASDGGIYVSTNYGLSFTDLTENLAISQFYKIAVAQQNSGNIVGGLQDNGGFAFSNDTWNVYYGADGMDCAISPTNADTYYGFLQYGNQLYKTENGGITVSALIIAPSAETDLDLDDSGGNWVTPMVSNSKGDIYAGYSQLYKLENNVWTKVSDHSFGGDLNLIEIDPADDNVIYVSRANTLYKSTNAGITFIPIGSSFGGTINSIEINNVDSNIGYIVSNFDVYKSTNMLSSSPSYTNITNNLPSENKLVIKHHARSGKNTLYLGTTLGVYYLNDDGPNWETFDNNLPNVAITDLEINEEDRKIFAATFGRGVFASPIPYELPPVDVKLVSISKVSCSSTTPEITVKNQGANILSEITINYSINGTGYTHNWTGNINSEEEKTFSLPNLSITSGNKTINIEVTTANDAYDTNNKGESSFIANTTNKDPTTINNFENTTDDSLFIETLGSTSNGWMLGTPNNTLLNSASSGTNAYVTNTADNYSNLTTSYLYTKCYNLTKISNPELNFKMAFDIEKNWDYFLVEYTTNQGATWSILGTAEDPNWYNSSYTENNLPGAQWTGEGEEANSLGGFNATIHDYRYDLAAFTSEANIIFRFKFFADQFVNEEGVLIDDLVVKGTILNVEDIELQDSFSIYPNPSTNIFNLVWNRYDKTTIYVYDYIGKLVKREIVNKGEYLLDLSSYNKGLYIIKIDVNGKQATKKIILEE